jgi:hypothetical protein
MTMAYLINLHDAESKSSVAADLLQWPSAQRADIDPSNFRRILPNVIWPISSRIRSIQTGIWLLASDGRGGLFEASAHRYGAPCPVADSLTRLDHTDLGSCGPRDLRPLIRVPYSVIDNEHRHATEI